MKRDLILCASCAGVLLCGCIKLNSGGNSLGLSDNAAPVEYINTFMYNTMRTYYLWIDEESVQSGMQSWGRTADPQEKVLSLRYKDSAGNEVDRWTQATDDYESFVNSVNGVESTYGYDFSLYYADSSQEYVEAVVTFVYADSPASAAGLQRGDVILSVDGAQIPTANYYSIVSEKLLGSTSCTLGLSDGRSVSMNSVTMYCNPVNVVKTFDCGGKKVAYLHFTSFTEDACADLIEACNQFKKEGVSELVLDLRYNGGGYVTTEELLASMLAPASEVNKGSLLSTEVFNSTLTEAWGSDEGKHYFKTSFDVDGKTLSTASSNIGLSKIYALISGGSASASEALICELKPYVDITTIGEQSHGKFCAGIIMSGAMWYEMYRPYIYESEYQKGVANAGNWGLYVMYGRYADKNGVTLSMPSGLTPDYAVRDNPLDGYQLGDTQETLLKQALTLAGYDYGTSSAKALASCEASSAKALASCGAALERPHNQGWGVFVNSRSR